MKQGIIVFLNGTSSSGKTSISIELKKQSEVPIYHLSVDDFCNGMFLNYIDFINEIYPDLEPTAEEDGAKVAQIITNPMISLYYSTIKLFSALGMNVIVDTVIDQDECFNACVDLLADHPFYLSG